MRDGRDLYVAVGDHREAAVVSANIAEILINQRRADEAEEVLEAALRTARGLGDAEILATVHLQFARLRVAQQGSTDGLEFARLARDEFTRLGQTHLLLEAAIVEADARSIGGDPLAGLRELDAAIRQMGDSAAYLAAKTACARARALVRLRRYEDAESEIAMGLAAAEQQGLLYEQALLLDLGAAARRACGKAPDPVAEAKARAILDALEVLD
jgi:hypothetical protein